MARQRRVFQNLRLIAGVGLIGLGLFVLGGNVMDAVDRLSGIVGVRTGWAQEFGGLMAGGLTVLRVWQCFLFDRREFLRGVSGVLISFWPMVLVVAGAVLTGMASRAESRNSQGKIEDMSN